MYSYEKEDCSNIIIESPGTILLRYSSERLILPDSIVDIFIIITFICHLYLYFHGIHLIKTLSLILLKHLIKKIPTRNVFYTLQAIISLQSHFTVTYDAAEDVFALT